MKRQACPICEFQQKAESSGRADSDDFKPKRRVLVWLVCRKTEAEKKTTEENPQAWSMGWTVDRDISKICKDRETGQLYQIDHPEAGYDIFFDKSGEKEQTKYTGFALSRRESSIQKAYVDFIVKNPLPTILLWRDYAEVKYLFEGEAVDAKDVKQAAEVVPVAPGPVTLQALPPTPVVYSSAPIVAPTNGSAVNMPSAPPPGPPPTSISFTPPPPLPPPPPKPFVSEWTGKNCAQCGNPTFTTPDGDSCQASHLQKTIQFPPTPPPPIVMPTGPVLVDQTQPSAADRAAGAAAKLQARFHTGPK